MATAGIFFPVVLGEPRTIVDQRGGDAWRNAIYDFQTLITGVSAVVAAYLAIKQSQVIEANSERRHQQLLELNLRPARLMISRSVFPMVEYIEIALPEMQSWHDALTAEGGAWFVAQNMIDLRRATTHWANIVHDDQLDVAKKYFDGHMEHALRRSRQAAQNINLGVSNLEMRLAPLTGRDGEKELVTGAMQEPVGLIAAQLQDLLEFLTEFATGLRKLEKDYLKSA
ncbi:hypothetical protein RLPCCGM1_c2047 [Rhizobium leguminosarum bv. phaseoli CCGM1]|nr:hypothetical protein RLPCCGM1_c2047 [Rhizobium leguminosarum bv. phaseoli CCGM1]